MSSQEEYDEQTTAAAGEQSGVEEHGYSRLRAEGWRILERDFTHKTIVTDPYDLTYGYYISPDVQGKKDAAPVLLLLHGFPDDAYLWTSLLPTLTKSPYPMILVDLLGCASSSKPLEAKMYNFRQQTGSLRQILDREEVRNNIIPVGHDWGSAVAQRFYLEYKDRCVGLAPMSLAFSPPTDIAFNLPETNRSSEKRFGYPRWEYRNFFTAEDGPRLMEQNLDRFYEALHGSLASTKEEERGRDIWMRQLFCVPGMMRQYVSGAGEYETTRVPLKPYARDEEFKRRWIERLRRQGLEAPLCYYKAMKQNTNLEDDRELLRHGGDGFTVVTKPYLYIAFTDDWVSRTDMNREPVRNGLLRDYERHVVRAGHWAPYEKPQEIAEILVDWLSRRFPV